MSPGLGGLIALAVCLAAVGAISLATPDLSADYRYRYVRADLGDWASLREFDVRITKVELARSMVRNGETLDTEHRYVVVSAEAAARTRTQYFQTVRLETADGHRYDPRSEWSSAGPPITEPGFSSAGSWVFEIPAGRVAGARLIVGPTGGEVTRYDAAALLDLDLSRASTTEPGPLEPAETRVWVTS